jgi:hypothetical protein
MQHARTFTILAQVRLITCLTSKETDAGSKNTRRSIDNLYDAAATLKQLVLRLDANEQ